MSFLKKITLLPLALLLFACGANRQPLATQDQIEDLNALVSEGSYRINVNTARPLATGSINRIANSGLLPRGSNVGRINLVDTASYLRVFNDSVAADLPYYGERQMGAPYNQDRAGILFKGVPQKFEVIPNAKTSGYIVNFIINNATESFNVTVRLLPDLSSAINVNSSHRTAIWYNGLVSKYDSVEYP
ncbi:DUF4251 domain-containing protein [Flagellimonas onchidii]|uniref:DUF4251 domain-containing protein n=1 Tax=Flagellimonas onchidii TaxID=2562684 RepID=UPI0010A61358|nr:DUF4251 domain-containing protein [Allomuricauda onchidii]